MDTGSVLGWDNDLKAKDNSLDVNLMPLREVAIKEQKPEETDTESNQSNVLPIVISSHHGILCYSNSIQTILA